jgi:hypothetical protein
MERHKVSHGDVKLHNLMLFLSSSESSQQAEEVFELREVVKLIDLDADVKQQEEREAAGPRGKEK